MTGFRLPAGGVINRDAPLSFTFDGKPYQGFQGDTLASALLASGVTLFGRSFKYHRPRGLLAAGSEEPNALTEIGTGANRDPNSRATMVALTDGLVAASQNRFPTLKSDLLSINSRLAPLFAAGFYYKTFMWPAAAWEKIYEPMIRRAAGLGRNAELPDPAHYEKTTAFCDVLIIGAGTAGIAAAQAAEGRVIICDEGFAPPPALPDHVLYMPSTTVFGVYDGGTYGALTLTKRGQTLTRIIAKRSILATGAIERPLLFGNNDLPGVMLAGAVEKYATHYAAAPGKNGILFLYNDNAASLITTPGIALAAIIDVRPKSSATVHELAASAGVPVFAGSVITEAEGTLAVKAAKILRADGSITTLACDFIAMSGGWNPALHLTTHLDGKPVWDDARATFLPGTLPPGMAVVGAAAGAGLNENIQPYWGEKATGKAFVDFQNDVTARDVKLSKQEGFVAVEHLKRYTTLGMATDQGKTANINGMALMAAETGKSIAATGTTKFRPPYTPVAIGALAGPHKGKHFKPTRYTPTHDWAAAQGAVFIETGLWLRAQYFPRAGEDWFAATMREAKTVRAAVGICDVTTLGKIDIQGPDAARFLELVYTNSWQNLAVGRVRYGLMLREDGFVMDDGTCARLGDTHFVMTTTTANAGKVFQHLEFCHQVLFPELDVSFISVTDQWAQIAVAGPHSRATLAKLVDAPFDIGNTAFPYMAAASLTICGGTRARLFRISFSGELAYEVAVPAAYGGALAAALMEAGSEFGIAPYGTEALGVLRVEKGHPAGPELNGQTTAHDIGLAKLLSKKKYFIGRALAARPALTDPARPSLVGLKPVNQTDILKAGSHLLTQGAEPIAANDQGWITSALRSCTLGHSIALAMLTGGPARLGEIIRVYDPVRNGDMLAEVVAPVFYDPQGARLHA